MLLCTFNGQRFLAEQLQSIALQSFTAWTLWASDDGSTDQTGRMLAEFGEAWGPDRVTTLSGPAEGLVRNFSTLVANDRIAADAYAFSDQDDVWERDKLERAMRWLSEVPASTPGVVLFAHDDDR